MVSFSLASVLFPCLAIGALVGPEGIEAEGQFLKMVVTPENGAGIHELRLGATDRDIAGPEGLIEEGFGVGSYYIPNRRLNKRLEVLEQIFDRPVIRYSYDCEGPNINGLRVTRVVELLVNEASLRVRWRVENRSTEDQWIAPWVRFEVRPGGGFGPRDRLDLPTLAGVLSPGTSGYYAASRNWAAATDPETKDTVYGVFNADQIHSFLAINEPDDDAFGFQAAFVPFLFKTGATWETVYRIGVVRGLSHVDFATDEFAAQIEYTGGRLQLLIAPVKAMPGLILRSRVCEHGGRVSKLPGRRFDLMPNTVVRCSYEWTPSGEGAFELLGQVLRGEEPVPLGADTASPHGGLDTQFHIGQGKPAPMEPWTDAVHSLDHGSRRLKRSLASTGDTAMWFESSLEKIFAEDIPEPTGKIEPTARVTLARNERESFQVVIRPPEGQNLRDLSFHVRDLHHENGRDVIPASDIAVARVAYHPVRVPSHFEAPTGLWPDPLPPFKPFTAAGGQCHPVWFTIYARAGIAAGAYTGLLEVDSPDLGPAELFIEAVVYDFDLPTTPALKTDFGYWPENALTWCKRFGWRQSSETLDRAFLDNALEHRVTLREAAQFLMDQPDPSGAPERFVAHAAGLVERGATAVPLPPSIIEDRDQLIRLNDLLKTRRLESRVFCPIADLPPQSVWPQLLEGIRQWKEVAPAIPLMVTTYGLNPFLPEQVDIWAVHLPVLDTTHNRTVLERAQGGGEVWWFVNHEPARPYGNFFIEFAGIEHRILFWQAWALGIRGFHYHGINLTEPTQNPYENQLDISPTNGNGSLVYPGPAGPVSSIRWEIIRDGIEDYDYLVLFQQRLRDLRRAGGNEALLERAGKVFNLNELVPDLVTFPRDPAVLLQKRDEIAQMIHALDQALAR